MINKTVLQFKLQYPEDRADASEPHGFVLCKWVTLLTAYQRVVGFILVRVNYEKYWNF